MRSLGIDIATCTGLALVEGDESRGTTIEAPNGQRGYQRLQLIAGRFIQLLENWNPDIILIEGYGMGMHGNVSSFITVVEIGTMIRMALYQRGRSWWEVPPTTLKKWVTGKGNAKKVDMATHARQKWGYSSPSDDIIDALALAQLGQLPASELMALKGVSLGKS